ncbi:hypothetical protein [Sphingobium nicotianae]|uniref:DUF3108 domain-containing protein n=1 Tax=Sphingobium nicotianae TaxID=2782607 RepID=A0A9X1DEZ2_9SPHN|nr:hypothetical protein [Sphingobium nicotianae]MBT2188723.1 hypothetical protein [Sphingobium nicotianae]
MTRSVLFGLAMLIWPAALWAAPVQLPCKIPGNADFSMTNEQHGWARDGKPFTVTVTQRFHFQREAAGNRLTLGIISATSDLADAAARKRLDTAFGPNRQEPIEVWLDETGQIVRVDDLARHWQAYLGQIEQVARDMEAAGQSSARGRATLAILRDADEATRIGLVAGSVGPLLRYCGQSADGVAADGQLRVTAEKDTAQLRETASYEIDLATGLAHRIERRVTIKAQPDKPELLRWRFDRLP